MVEFTDLTLREGSQVPGLEISEEMGLQVLDQLSRLAVSCVEVSFPRAAPRSSWYRRADDLGLRTKALARALPGDVDAALAVAPDEIEVIVTSSDIQLEHALGKSREEARTMLAERVEQVRDGGVAPGVTLMDSMRADDAFLRRLARTAVDSGAKHVTLADTTGAGTPQDVRETVSAVVDEVGTDATVTIHTHDDKDLATANAAAGVAAGATSVDATVGGIGERAGNAPLEAVAVDLAERGETVDLALDELVSVCRRVHDILDIDIPPGKSIVGDRVYRHESGLHTAAMLEAPSTYEPFDPATYGGQRELLFGGETGRGAVRALLLDIGIDPTDDAIAAVRDALETAAAENGGPLTESDARDVAKQHTASL